MATCDIVWGNKYSYSSIYQWLLWCYIAYSCYRLLAQNYNGPKNFCVQIILCEKFFTSRVQWKDSDSEATTLCHFSARQKLQHLASVCKILKSLLCHTSFMPQAQYLFTSIYGPCVCRSLVCVCVHLEQLPERSNISDYTLWLVYKLVTLTMQTVVLGADKMKIN